MDAPSLKSAGIFTHPSRAAFISSVSLDAEAPASVQAEAPTSEVTLEKPPPSARLLSLDCIPTGPRGKQEKSPTPAQTASLDAIPTGPRQTQVNALTPPQTSSFNGIPTGPRKTDQKSSTPALTKSLHGIPTGPRLKPSSRPDADDETSSNNASLSRILPVTKEHLKDPALLPTDHPGASQTRVQDVKTTNNADAATGGGHHPVDPPPTVAENRTLAVAASEALPKQTSRLPARPTTSPVTSRKRPSALDVDMDTRSVFASSVTAITSQDNSPSKRLKVTVEEETATDSASQEVERYLGLKGTSDGCLPSEIDRSPAHSLLDRLSSPRRDM